MAAKMDTATTIQTNICTAAPLALRGAQVNDLAVEFDVAFGIMRGRNTVRPNERKLRGYPVRWRSHAHGESP